MFLVMIMCLVVGVWFDDWCDRFMCVLLGCVIGLGKLMFFFMVDYDGFV